MFQSIQGFLMTLMISVFISNGYSYQPALSSTTSNWAGDTLKITILVDNYVYTPGTQSN
jgi:hypothetical protein